MTFEEAIRKSIRKYREGKAFAEMSKVNGQPPKYTMEFFDELEKDIMKEQKKGSSKKAKSETIDNG